MVEPETKSNPKPLLASDIIVDCTNLAVVTVTLN